jgi:membrane-associated protein
MENLIELILHTDDALYNIVVENIYKAYFILFLLIMFETGLIIFPFLPGDGLLFSAGVIAASTSINIWILLILLIAAAILGNMYPRQKIFILNTEEMQSLLADFSRSFEHIFRF